jgi:hypothetical protein
MTELSVLTGRQLLAEVRDVVYDVPVFLTTPLYRRWHCRWGATPAEVSDPLPGDALLPHAQFRSTRAITPLPGWPWPFYERCDSQQTRAPVTRPRRRTTRRDGRSPSPGQTRLAAVSAVHPRDRTTRHEGTHQ